MKEKNLDIKRLTRAVFNMGPEKPDPLDMMAYWMVERERIRRARLAGKPKPWTEDPILQQYRFCNVFRIHDTVTVHYLKWIKQMPFPTERQRLNTLTFNTLMYRVINWPDTLDELPPVLSYADWPKYKKSMFLPVMKRRTERGFKCYTSAYMLTGLKGIEKYESTAVVMDDCFKNMKATPMPDDTPHIQSVAGYLQLCRMVAGFLSYEVVTDLTYIHQFEDQDTWANAGPGAKRGLNRLAGRPLNGAIKDAEALSEMRGLLPYFQQHWPWKDQHIGLREIEHSLCEFDKYARAFNSEGRPKALYNGKGE